MTECELFVFMRAEKFPYEVPLCQVIPLVPETNLLETQGGSMEEYFRKQKLQSQ